MRAYACCTCCAGAFAKRHGLCCARRFAFALCCATCVRMACFLHACAYRRARCALRAVRTAATHARTLCRACRAPFCVGMDGGILRHLCISTYCTTALLEKEEEGCGGSLAVVEPGTRAPFPTTPRAGGHLYRVDALPLPWQSLSKQQRTPAQQTTCAIIIQFLLCLHCARLYSCMLTYQQPNSSTIYKTLHTHTAPPPVCAL